MRIRRHSPAVCLGLVLIALVAAPARSADPALAPYLDDRDAAEAGLKVGVGTATLEGPPIVEVLSHNTWTLVYTAGPAGVRTGGGIRIGMRHSIKWSPPQTENPEADGYLTVATSRDVPTKVYCEYNNHRARFFRRYHPWQNMVEVILPDESLNQGETIRVTYGDRSGGSRGIRVQPFDEPNFVFKVYADPRADDAYYPLIDNPSIRIVAAAPYRLGIVTPSDAVAGEPTWCIVRAEDRYGNPADGYRGTVSFNTSCGRADLPPEYTFNEADRGVHRFENVVFGQEGCFTINVKDGEFEAVSNPIRVAPEKPERLLLWGDLHGHTLHSDGRGTVEQFYDFAQRVAGLDFCAVTDHAFEVTDAMWDHSKRVTNRVYRPGEFVTFQAYEWSGQTDVGGDHNIFFLEDDPPIYRSRSYYTYQNLQMYHGPEPQVNHVEDLFAVLADRFEERTVFAIPHWGGRRGNPDWHHPRVQRMIEVFSEHRRSEDWVTRFLKNRYRLGIMASTDGHFGNPGYGYLKPTYDWNTQEIGMATVAVLARERTREAIFEALYDRHVYATSGERIILEVDADGHPMGSEYRTSDAPVLTIHAVTTAPIDRIEIKKNSETVQTLEPEDATRFNHRWQDPDFRPDQEAYYYVRLLQVDNEEAISSPIWVN